VIAACIIDDGAVERPRIDKLDRLAISIEKTAKTNVLWASSLKVLKQMARVKGRFTKLVNVFD